MTQVKIIQDEKKPVPVEILAEGIRSISAGIKRLRNGPLTGDALVHLIQQACPSFRTQRYQAKTRPSIKQVEAVLAGIENLERLYLKK